MKYLLTKNFILSFLIVAILAISTACSSDQKVEQKVKQEVTPKETEAVKADTVYKNVKFYTVNEAQPWAEAVAIKGSKFIAIGTSDEMKGLIG